MPDPPIQAVTSTAAAAATTAAAAIAAADAAADAAAAAVAIDECCHGNMPGHRCGGRVESRLNMYGEK